MNQTRVAYVDDQLHPSCYADSSSTRLRPLSLILSAISRTSLSVSSLSLIILTNVGESAMLWLVGHLLERTHFLPWLKPWASALLPL
jgi:hypothetical protein